MDTSNENNAEAVDETVTTTDRDDESVRRDFPPARPMGVEDPSRRADGSIAPDDAAIRAWRRDESDRREDPGPVGHE